jgi:hypothetical protein
LAIYREGRKAAKAAKRDWGGQSSGGETTMWCVMSNQPANLSVVSPRRGQRDRGRFDDLGIPRLEPMDMTRKGWPRIAAGMLLLPIWLACGGSVRETKDAQAMQTADGADAALDVREEQDPCSRPCQPSGPNRPLSCICPGNPDCPENISEVSPQDACETGWIFTTQVSGCGKLTVRLSTGFSTKAFTFDAASGKLIGAVIVLSDTAPEVCVYGDGPLDELGSAERCEHIETCMLCEDGGPPVCM